MAKKTKKVQEIKYISRKQLTRRERERKVQRTIIIVSAVILAVVLVLTGYGIYDSQFRPYEEIVLRVDERNIDMDYFIDMLKLYLMGADSYVAPVMADTVLNAIQRNLILIKGAEGLGYTVDKPEVDQALAENLVPDKQAYRDLYIAQTLENRLMQEYFGKKIPKSADQVKVQAMVFETRAVAEEAINRIKEGTSFLDLAKIYGVEKVTKERGGDLGWLPKGLVARVLGYENADVLEKVAFSLKAGEISEPVYDANIVKGTGYWIVKCEERDDDISVHARAILVGSLEDALKVKKELSAGTDFAALAKDISQDLSTREDGGDYGWLKRGYGDTVVTNVAFGLQPGEVSDPVRDVAIETRGGYWVVKVLEREENKDIEEVVRNNMLQNEFDMWFVSVMERTKVEKLLTVEQRDWAVAKVMKSIKK